MRWLWVVLILVLGCAGEIRRSDPSLGSDGGVGPVDGGGAADDGGGIRLMDGAGLSDGGVEPGVDGGPAGTDAGPADPCASVTCGTNERCDGSSGACVCVAGYVDMGAGCVAVPPGDPAGRTSSEVCARWRDGHVENASTAWTMGATDCDLGTLSPDAVDDTVRRVTLFRWLVGLGPVTNDAARHDIAQACAVLMRANGRISHTPDSSWDCYTSAGAEGAGSSNLALGVGTPGAAIDLYMADPGTPSLGHRRWVLNDPLGKVSIGFAGTAQCLGVFDGSGSTSRPWTAYPNQGPAPAQTAMASWSFHSRSLSLAGADVSVQRVSDGANLAVSVFHPPDGYGPATVAWDPSGWTPAAGESYRVTITGLSGGDITYVVQLVSC